MIQSSTTWLNQRVRLAKPTASYQIGVVGTVINDADDEYALVMISNPDMLVEVLYDDLEIL